MRVGFSFKYKCENLEHAKNIGYEKVANLLGVERKDVAQYVDVELKVELNTEDDAATLPYEFTLIGSVNRNSVLNLAG